MLSADLNDTTGRLRELCAEMRQRLAQLRALAGSQEAVLLELGSAGVVLCSMSAEVSRWERLLAAARICGELEHPHHGRDAARPYHDRKLDAAGDRETEEAGR